MVAMRQASPLLTKLGPTWFRRWLVERIPFKQVQDLKHVVDVLYDTSARIIEDKKAALEKGEIAVGKDIISILRKHIPTPLFTRNGPHAISSSEGKHGRERGGQAARRTDQRTDEVRSRLCRNAVYRSSHRILAASCCSLRRILLLT